VAAIATTALRKMIDPMSAIGRDEISAVAAFLLSSGDGASGGM
jgi:hypothetical protein